MEADVAPTVSTAYYLASRRWLVSLSPPLPPVALAMLTGVGACSGLGLVRFYHGAWWLFAATLHERSHLGSALGRCLGL